MREYDMRIRGWSSDVCSSDLLVNIIDVICLRAEDRSSDGLEYGRDDHSIIPVSRFTGHIVCHIPVCVLPGVDSGFDSAFGYAGSDIVRIVLQCAPQARSEEHTSELQSLMRISYAVFCLKKKQIPAKKHNAQ